MASVVSGETTTTTGSPTYLLRSTAETSSITTTGTDHLQMSRTRQALQAWSLVCSTVALHFSITTVTVISTCMWGAMLPWAPTVRAIAISELCVAVALQAPTKVAPMCSITIMGTERLPM